MLLNLDDFLPYLKNYIYPFEFIYFWFEKLMNLSVFLVDSTLTFSFILALDVSCLGLKFS